MITLSDTHARGLAEAPHRNEEAAPFAGAARNSGPSGLGRDSAMRGGSRDGSAGEKSVTPGAIALGVGGAILGLGIIPAFIAMGSAIDAAIKKPYERDAIVQAFQKTGPLPVTLVSPPPTAGAGGSSPFIGTYQQPGKTFLIG